MILGRLRVLLEAGPWAGPLAGPEAAMATPPEGAYCANTVACQHVWWCGVDMYVPMTAVGSCLWMVLFWLLATFVYPLCEGWIKRNPSKYAEEDDPAWFANHIVSTIHAVTVVSIVAWPLCVLFPLEPERQYTAVRDHFPFEYVKVNMCTIANSSFIFFCYTIADTAITFYMRKMTPAYFIHHIVFIFFCLLVQKGCFGAYLAGWLLVMETSTVFLNGLSFFRNRFGYGHPLVRFFFFTFAVAFLLFRLVGTIYIAIHFGYAVFAIPSMFEVLPRWHVVSLAVALWVVVVLQFFWAFGLAKKAQVVMAHKNDGSSSKGGGCQEAAGDKAKEQ